MFGGSADLLKLLAIENFFDLPDECMDAAQEMNFNSCFRSSHGPTLKMLVSKAWTVLNISLFAALEIGVFCRMQTTP